MTKSRIETELSDDDLAEFRRLLGAGRLTIGALAAWLAGRGYEISRSAVGRYSQKFETVAAKLRQSRAVTEALVTELGDAAAQGKQGRLLVEMTRGVVFDLLTKLQTEEVEIDTKDVQQLGKGLAELGRALRLDQDFELKVRQAALKEAAEKLESVTREAKAAGEKGLSEDRIAQLRRVLAAEA